MTSAITAVLAVWAAYAFSGAGVLPRLPLRRMVLSLVVFVLVCRGVAFYWLMPLFPGNSMTFWLVSSALCLLLGSLYALGLVRRWTHLGAKAHA
ncbi:hypothetical protein [Ferrimonas pelagia]|uniref:Uncharacterized protein n=1 Tax=Ferrimonas pelagia TaxID=1177826 RepID=A0ABP9FIS8_9GAMM